MSGFVITIRRGDPPEAAVYEVTEARLLTVIAVLDDPGNPKPLNQLRRATKQRTAFNLPSNEPPSEKLFTIAEGDTCEILERAEDANGNPTAWFRIG